MNIHQIERVRQRAFTLWEVSGKAHGRDLDHWLQAEGEVMSLAASPAAPAKASKPRKTPEVAGAKTARSRKK